MQELASCCFRLPRAGLKPCPDCGGSGPHRRSPACSRATECPQEAGAGRARRVLCRSVSPWGFLARSRHPGTVTQAEGAVGGTRGSGWAAWKL